jgi:lysophospholipid acyltransferase
MSSADVKYTVSLFLAYPFAAILRAIPNKHLKHLVSMIGGIFLVQWVFGPDWIHSFVSSAVTYLICAIAPRKYCPTLVFLWAMGYMTGSHIYRMYVSYLSGVFDFTGTQMVLTMKLTSFAYNLYDGTYDRKNVFPDMPHEDPRKDAIYADRRRFAITKLPGLLEFFGYIYCFTCLLAGPAFEYNDYVHAIDGSAFKHNADDKLEKKESEPSSALPAMQRLLVGVACLGGHLYLSGMYPLSNVYNLAWIKSHSHVQRFGALVVTLFAERLKYYFAWKVAEGASVLGGFGFQGYDEKGKVIGWRGVENIEIITFELAPNVQTLSRAWNKRTQGWLERYTYLRSNRSLTLTYFVSGKITIYRCLLSATLLY